uniref:UDP-glucuronosyltransferase n=1 Tax=Ditylenchus dipsaci TaxID=166011 RepID=A0A915DWC5_9BILA
MLDRKDPFAGVQNSLRGFSDFVELQAGCCEDLVDNKALMTQLEAENYDSRSFSYSLIFCCKRNVRNTYFSSYVPNMKLTQPIISKAFGADFPSLKEITKNFSLVFVNSNEFFELPHPISNKVQYVGGIVKSEAKPISHEVKSILDNSESGKSYLTAFAHFPTYDFIWKLKPGDNESAMFSSTPNVHVVHWFDQKAVLEHPKVKAFMTHCGLNSINEAALAAVPMIGIPLFADQLYNAAIMINKGIGVFVPIQSTNDPEVLIEALDKKKLKNSPFTPEEKFVKWVEFAAEFPTSMS